MQRLSEIVLNIPFNRREGPGDHSRVPGIVWAVAVVVAGLRGLPFLMLLLASAAPGTVPVLVGYIPRDWLAYVALIREGAGPFTNPFTTEIQSGRLLLLLHQVLGAVHEVTGADPFWLLELSRIPLIALFTIALWRFVSTITEDRRERIWASGLVLASGGFAYVVRWALPMLPERVRSVASQDLWSAHGWSTFEALYNPLWIAGLALALVTLKRLLQPGGPAALRDRATASIGIFVTWLVHPYSAVIIGAAAMGAVVSEWISLEPTARARLANVAKGLAPGVLACGALLAWQRQDPAFAATSSGFFGPQMASPAWYPVTLGAVGFFALRGLRGFAQAAHPWRHGLVGWAGAIILLHSSNVVNGYHFVYGLHAPLAILAARPVAVWFQTRGTTATGKFWAAILAVALFAEPVATSAHAVHEARRNYVSEPVARLLATLAELPPGNVLAPPDLANFIPAYGPHRVFVGHWFMTPAFEDRSREYEAAIADSNRPEQLAALVARERIRYLVLRSDRVGLVPALGYPGTWQPFGDLILVQFEQDGKMERRSD